MDERRMRVMRIVAREDAGEAPMADVLEMRLGGRVFGLAASDVTEVVRPMPLTPVPMAPDHFLGLANIHGQIVCVIEPCRLLGLPEPGCEDDEFARLVCLRHPRMRVAMRVDAIPAIHRVREELLPARAADRADDVHGSVPVAGEHGEVELPLLNTAALLHE